MKSGNSSASLRRKLIRTVLLACLILSLLPSVAHAQQTAVPKRILKLYWYDQDRSVTFHQSFQAALQSAPAGTVEYYPEYLESLRFPGENQSLLLRDYLRKKYANRTIDVVVATPDAPLNFIVRYRGDLFPTAPLVFSSVRRPSRDELAAGAGATGVIQLSTHRQTLDLALRIHPDTNQVVIIGGTIEHTKLETLAREALQGYESKVRFTYLTDLAPEELIAKTKSLPERSIILYIWQQSVNKNGKLLESADLLALIAQSASVPIYGLAFTSLGHGIIGGYVSSTEAIATRVAEIALRIANGERAQDIPIESTPAVPTFDWRQLRRWGISEGKLPPGSIVRFKELTFWDHYKWYILGVLALCALQALLISILLIERARRRRAKAALDERLRFETLLSELSADFTGLQGPEVDLGIDIGLKRLGRFLGVNAGAFLELSKSDWGTSQIESNTAVLGEPPLAGMPDEQRHWCMDQLRSGTTVNLPRVAEEVIGGKSSGSTGIKSLLAIPIAANGSACALTFATRESYREWREDLVPRLRLAGEIFASAVVRKKHEEALRASEERSRAILRAIPDLMFLMTSDGVYLDFHTTNLNELSVQPDHFLGKNMRDVLPPELAEKLAVCFRRAVESNEPQSIEYELELKGQEQSYEARIVPTNGDRLLNLVRNITERKAAEEALRFSEERFRQLAENIQAVFFITEVGSGTALGRILYVSPAYETIWGRSCESLYRETRSWLAAVHPEDHERLKPAVPNLAKGEFDEEFRIIQPGGKVRWLHCRVFPILDARGEVYRVAGIVDDITERKQADEALRDREERLRLTCEAGRMGVWDWDFASNRVRWSRDIFLILGLESFSIQPSYQSWVERVHPEDRSQVEDAVNAAIRENVDYQAEYRILLPDGTIRSVEGRGRPTRNKDGNCISMQGLLIDITERKQAEKLLRESEERYRNVVETQTELICRILPDTTLTFVNDAYCRYFKRTRAELIGCKFIDFIPEPVQQQVIAHIEALFDQSGTETSEHEHQILMSDGTIGWHHWVNRKIFGPAGRVIEVQGIGRDITERKLAENALRESEERYRNVVETQTELICRYECDTTLTFVNDAYCRYFGKTREQLIGMKFLELMPEEARPAAVTHVESLIANPRIETDEHEVIRADGTIGWQQWVDYTIRDADGRILEMQAIGRDITERKRLEEDLQGREREFSTLVENSPDVISRLDRDLRFLYISPIVERVLGVPSQHFIGKTTQEVGAPPHDWNAFESSCRQAFQTGEIVDREFSYGGRHYHSRLIPEFGTGSSADSVMCISEDITERRRAERELVQMSVRLLGLQEEERRRIARQLHDVTAQNLFATTINLARLQSPAVSSEVKEVLAECQTLCEQALQEIRTLSYLLHPPILDQAGLVSALKWYIDGFSKRSGIDVGLVVTREFDRLPREVEADLFRIVQESLSNVHRHSGSNTASVRLEQQATQVAVQIRDEGHGMRRDKTRLEADESILGVGIPGMRHRLRQLGGNLTIESNSQGTTVTATVPLRAERRQHSRASHGSG